MRPTTPALAARYDKALADQLAVTGKVAAWAVGAGLLGFHYWAGIHRMLSETLRPRNAVGPFGTPADMFVILRRPDGSRVIDDVRGKDEATQASLLDMLAHGEVCRFHVEPDA